MAVTFEAHPFWDFSIELYGKDGVSPALIGFQDRHGMDVNMLFLCLWMGHSGRGVLDAGTLAQALTVSRSWNPDVVCALRAVRIHLRDGVPPISKELSDAVRQEILAVEIDCEHVEQLSLVAGIYVPEDPGVSEDRRLSDCIENLSLYFRQFDLATTEHDRADLFTVLAAAFPGVDRQDIDRRCTALLG